MIVDKSLLLFVHERELLTQCSHSEMDRGKKALVNVNVRGHIYGMLLTSLFDQNIKTYIYAYTAW